MPLVAQWLEDAVAANIQPNPNAMTLATVAADGQPSARVVLVKGLSERDGYLVFYTHYGSRKGRELAGNPLAAAVMHWDTLGRQLRFEGPVLRPPEAESDAYFAGRPWLSQLNAWGSDQSEPIETRGDLIAQAHRRAEQLGFQVVGDELAPQEGQPAMARPSHWGGYRLWIAALEFWVHGDGRFHDRIRYQRSLSRGDTGQLTAGPWSSVRLQP